MLSGEGNENGENTAIDLISKKATLHVQHTFFLYISLICRCFARLYVKPPETSGLVTRFMEEMSYVFLFTFFSLPLIFALVAASISRFLTAAAKFSCCSSNKKMSPLLFISRSILAIALCCSFSRWASPTFSQFFCLSLSLYSKFVDMTVNLSLIL